MTIEERVAASRAAQGLPAKVTDPATLARIAALLITAPPARATTAASSVPSQLVRAAPDAPQDADRAGSPAAA